MADITWERLQVHVNAGAGISSIPEDPTKSRMTDPSALQALEWIRARMWDDKVMATALDVQDKGTQEAFIAGQLAMVEEGSWALKNILANANFRVGSGGISSWTRPLRHSRHDGWLWYLCRNETSRSRLGIAQVPGEQKLWPRHGQSAIFATRSCLSLVMNGFNMSVMNFQISPKT